MKKKKNSFKILALALIVAIQSIYILVGNIMAEDAEGLDNPEIPIESQLFNDYSCPAHTEHDEFCGYEKAGVCMHLCIECFEQKSPPEVIEEHTEPETSGDNLYFYFGEERKDPWEGIEPAYPDEVIPEEIPEEKPKENPEEKPDKEPEFLITSVLPLEESILNMTVSHGTSLSDLSFPSVLTAMVKTANGESVLPEIKNELDEDNLNGEIIDETLNPENPDHKEETPNPENPDHKEEVPNPENPDYKEETPNPENPDHKEEIPNPENPDNKEETPNPENPDHKEEIPNPENPEHKNETPNPENPDHKEEIPNPENPEHKDETPNPENSDNKGETPNQENTDYNGETGIVSIESISYSARKMNFSLLKSSIQTEENTDKEIEENTENQPEAQQIEIPVSWECATEYTGEAGQYVFHPVLPEGYAFEYGVIIPEITVNVIGRPILRSSRIVGIGTQSNPLQIDSAASLTDFAQSYNNGVLRKNYGIADDALIYVKLTANIDLSRYTAGGGFEPIGTAAAPFLGHFDGDGYAITKLSINRPTTKEQGLFGVVESRSVIENLGIRSAAVAGGDNTGILVGNMKGTVRNCYTTGNVKGTLAVGGVVGRLTGEVNTVWTNAAVDGTDTGGSLNVGGITGYATGSVNNAVVLSRAITGNTGTIGKIAGNKQSSVNNSFSWNAITCVPNSRGSNGKEEKTVILGEISNWPGGFKSDPWQIEKDSLPYLKNSENMPFKILEYFPLADLSGSGTQNAPFLIKSETDLYFLADEVNNGNRFTGVYFKLTQDIDLGGSEWTPIGSTYSFRGHFDGGSYKVYNFKITQPDKNYLGFFGTVKEGSITNFGIEDCEISGNSYLGPIGGHIVDSNIERCYSKNVTIKGKDSCIGGLMGLASYCDIKECFAQDMNVTGSHRVGGLVGYFVGSMYDVYTTGSVTSLGASTAGGIVGNSNSVKNIIENCFTTANIYFDNQHEALDFMTVGGISGFTAGHIQNAVCLSKSIEGRSDWFTNRISGNYFVNNDKDRNILNGISWEGTIVNGFMKKDQVQPNGYSWTDEDLKRTKNWGFSNPQNWSFPNDGSLPSLKYVPASESLLFPEWVSKDSLPEQMPIGNGTESFPYFIEKEENLMWLLGNQNNNPYDLLNKDAGTGKFTPKYFYQTKDLDLSSYRWPGIGIVLSDKARNKAFMGNYDGNGHIIKGLNGSKGLFHTVSKDYDETNETYLPTPGAGVVKNVAIVDCDINGIAGGIAYKTEGVEISGCSVTGKISGFKVGGIVCEAEETTIENCYTNVDITASHIAGGIAAEFYTRAFRDPQREFIEKTGRSISYCYSVGPITADTSLYNAPGNSSAGGIAGVVGIHSAIGKFVNVNTKPKVPTIESCYSVSPIHIMENRKLDTNDDPTVDTQMFLGGLVGEATGLNKKSFKNLDLLHMTNSMAFNPYLTTSNSSGKAYIAPIIGGVEHYENKLGGHYMLSNCSYWDGMALSNGMPINDQTETIKAELFWNEADDKTSADKLQMYMGGDDAPYDLLGLKSSPTKAVNGWEKRNRGELPILTRFKEFQSGVLPDHMSKTDNSVLRIGNYYDLISFGDRVNNGNIPSHVKKVVLTNNIAISNGVDWKPIGTKNNPFSLEFDGQGYRVSNITVDGNNIEDAGLFGYVKDGLIKNTVVSVNSIKGYNAGGLAGTIESTNPKVMVENCAVMYESDRNEIHINARRNGGGLVGEQKLATIQNCYSYLNVKGRSAGGIVGYSESGESASINANANVPIMYCIAAGTVIGDEAGGILGRGNKNPYVYKCVSLLDSVTSTYAVNFSGPFIGYGTIGAFNNVFWSGMSTGENMKGAGEKSSKSGDELAGGDGWPDVYKKGVWEYTDGVLPKLSALKSYDNSYPAYLDISGLNMDEDGRYMITSAKDFITMQNQIGVLNEYSYGRFIMMNNIDMSDLDTRYFTPIGKYKSEYINDSPADGEQVAYFRGELDGNGFAIKNLRIQETGEATGLFAYLGPGSNIHDLTLENVEIKGLENTGALAGVAGKDAVISNVNVSGSVTGGGGNRNTGGLVGQSYGTLSGITASDLKAETSSNFVGGIVGELIGELSDSTALDTVQVIHSGGNTSGIVGGLAGCVKGAGSISDSYFLGSIDGKLATGGIAGDCEGVIEKCYMAGSIFGTSMTGGIAGRLLNNGEIRNVYNLSAVYGGDKVGGIAGTNGGTIENAYSTGRVTGNSNTGGIVGLQSSSSAATRYTAAV